MSTWADDSYSHRMPIGVDNVGGSAGTHDITVAVPFSWDEFWNTIQADGDDIRLYDANGESALTYEWAGFSYANKTGTIEIDDYAGPGEGFYVVWLYYGNASATDASTVISPASAKTGYITLTDPVKSSNRIIAQKENPDDAKPRQVLSKQDSTTEFVWIDVTDMLEERCDPYNKRRFLAGVDFVQFQVLQADSDAAALYTEGNTRVTECNNRFWVRVEVKAGTTANDYTGSLLINTIDPQGDTEVLNPRFLIKVIRTQE